ncbi:MAG: hypothetical protein ABR907_15035 [Terracidiphilus sp.]
MIVTVFMLGLGLGSLAGGWLSTRKGLSQLVVFGLIEFSVGSFGAFSLWMFHRVGTFTAGASTITTGLISFALLLIPTMLMGSTLPLLVEHFVRRSGNIGESVGILYSVNTLGSAAACFAAALLLMRLLGEAGTVRIAVCFNLFVGATALFLQTRDSAPPLRQPECESRRPQETIPLWLGMLLAGITGFIALAYEIVWFRIFSFASGGLAPNFAFLLAFYLLGIAYGSLAVRDACLQKLGNDLRGTLAGCSNVVMLGTIIAFLVGPVFAFWLVHFESARYILVFAAAALLGAAFPLLGHAAINPAQNSGKSISFLYVSNIAGSTLGSFIVGFVVLDYWSTRATSLLLLGLGFLAACILAVLAGAKASKRNLFAGSAICLALALASGPLYSSIYERLLFKTTYNSSMKFSEEVENRSGVIGVYRSTADFGYPTRMVYSGGAYDGQINIDMMHDSNLLFRAFAICGLHPKPKNVLIIGLATGAWAQVVANDPEAERITIVEINPGFLSLIQKYPEVESLLSNPKVHIITDDGRRWLLGHPDNRFDFILMNTTWNFRANVSNLLSKEFMGLMKAHLKQGGIAYYNTTFSGEALATGAAAFPYALRIHSFLAVSDSPITLDKKLWRTALTSYRIDGRPVFDLAKPDQRAQLEKVVDLAGTLDIPGSQLESRASLLRRFNGVRLITDDNMGTEWTTQDGGPGSSSKSVY